MTNRDYKVIATGLRNAMPGPATGPAVTVWLAAVAGVSDALASDNPRFDPVWFMVAAGAVPSLPPD